MEREVRIERIRQQSDDGQVARVIDGPELHCDRDKAVAACIDYFKANRKRMNCYRYRKHRLSVGFGVVESACSKSSGAAGRKRAPTLYLPPKAASKTIAGPTSSIGGPVAPQPTNQKI